MKYFDLDERVTDCVRWENDNEMNTDLKPVVDLDALAALNIGADNKVENISYWWKMLKEEAQEVEEQIKMLEKRKREINQNADNLKKFLLEKLDGRYFESTVVKIYYQTSVSVKFDKSYIGQLSNEFLRFKEPELNKVAVKKAIQSGVNVPGCELVSKQNMYIKIKD